MDLERQLSLRKSAIRMLVERQVVFVYAHPHSVGCFCLIDIFGFALRCPREFDNLEEFSLSISLLMRVLQHGVTRYGQ